MKNMKNILRVLKRRLKSLTQTKAERRHTLVGPSKLWKMKRDFQIKFLKDFNLKPQHYLLDVGCGTLRGGIPLIDYLENGHYFGIESREEALDEGRKELQEARLEVKNPTLLMSPDISQLIIDQEFDFVWAFSVLIHMSDDILNDALNFVNKHLSAEGVFYANVHIGAGKEGKWEEFPIVSRTFEFYSEACTRNGLTVFDLGPLKNLGHDVSNVKNISNVMKNQDYQQRMLRISKI
ncbi:MAG: class I SAM-dependent methyltransferase [Thiomargarita sp.]|nr:class I SAM-dependent methyltransferase [Thiomargarita sp.]